MLIDSHCHLDDALFDSDREDVIQAAQSAGVKAIIIPAVMRANFAVVRQVAQQFEGGFYTLGIHPMCVQQSDEEDLDFLADAVKESMSDPRFVGIGEIGLDLSLIHI